MNQNQKIIDKLNEAIATPSHTECWISVRDAIKLLQEQGNTASESDWVDVKEGLPEDDANVIVAFNTGDVDYDFYDKQFKYWSRLRYDRRVITYWQSFPVAPVQQQREK